MLVVKFINWSKFFSGFFSEPTIRIYAKNRISEPKNFFIGIRELGPGANKPGYEEFLARTNSIALSKQVFITSSEASLDNYLKDENIFLLQASKHNMPYWVKSLIYPSIIKRNLLEFMNKFHSLDSELTNKPCSAKEALIIRILLVHEWRRIILKIPPNPSNFEDDEIDLGELFAALWSHKILITLFMVTILKNYQINYCFKAHLMSCF